MARAKQPKQIHQLTVPQFEAMFPDEDACKAYLKARPYQLTFANDGEAAVKRFAAAEFDLVLMDVKMGMMDGLTAIRALRQIERLTQEFGPDILRLKGILAFKDDPQRYVVQGVHMIIEGNHQRAWKEGEKRESRLVFIGRKLDEAMLKDGFHACRA